MANPAALSVIGAALKLTHTHSSAPAIDVLDLVMKGRQGQTPDFSEAGVRKSSLADPSSEFGQIVAAALDQGMSPSEWVVLTGDRADPVLRDGCLGVWRDEIFGTGFVGRYGVTTPGPANGGTAWRLSLARSVAYLPGTM